MTEERSTVRSRQLGDALRAAMRSVKLNGKSTAELLGWSESRVSRLITGKLGATEVEVRTACPVRGCRCRTGKTARTDQGPERARLGA